MQEDSFEVRCRKLRTRISRSRRQVDRQLHHVGDPLWHLSALHGVVDRVPGRWVLLAVVGGFILSRCNAAPGTTSTWQRELLGETVSAWLDRLAERVRAWIQWQPVPSGSAGMEDENA